MPAARRRGTALTLGVVGLVLFGAGAVIGFLVPEETLLGLLKPGMDCAPPRTQLCAAEGARLGGLVGLTFWSIAILLVLGGAAVLLRGRGAPREAEWRPGGTAEAFEERPFTEEPAAAAPPRAGAAPASAAAATSPPSGAGAQVAVAGMASASRQPTNGLRTRGAPSASGATAAAPASSAAPAPRNAPSGTRAGPAAGTAAAKPSAPGGPGVPGAPGGVSGAAAGGVPGGPHPGHGTIRQRNVQPPGGLRKRGA